MRRIHELCTGKIILNDRQQEENYFLLPGFSYCKSRKVRVNILAMGDVACLTIGSEDPTVWMLQLAGVGLGVTCMFYVPMTAISAVDYMILRKQQLSLRDLFNKTSTSRYWFWGGVNWVALIIFIADALFYLVFFDPANLIYRPLFVYFTGSLGAGIPCAIIYYLVMKLAVVKTGKGAYPTLANVER